MARYQDPKIEKHGSYWRIRPYVPTLKPGGVAPVRTSYLLGPAIGPDRLTPAEAKIKKQQVMAQINNRALVLSAQVPFSAVLDMYRETGMVALKTSTAKKYTSFISKHIEPVFRTLSLAEMDRQVIQLWVNGLAETLEPSSVESLRNCLSAIFSFADDNRLWSGRNPCERVKVPKRPRDRQPRREKRLVTIEQLQQFLAAIEDTVIVRAERARLIVLIACSTTLRVGEILGLQWGDIKAGAAMVRRRVYRGDVDEPKTAAACRAVPLGSLAAELGKPGAADSFIFAREGKPLDDRDLQQHVFRPAAKAVGIYFQGFGMHSFRQAGITWRQTIGGASPVEAMKAAGHTKLDMTMLYTLADAEREKTQVGAVQAAIASGKKARVQ